MSRIGKLPIEIPAKVEFKLDSGNVVSVKGPKGNLSRKLHHDMKISQEGNTVTVTPVRDENGLKKFHGLTRTLIANMVHGVDQGFSKSLTMIGVGYRAAKTGNNVTFTLGYSHPIEFIPPDGINIEIEKNTTVIVSGASKELVGQVAAKIRSLRPPEPYHGKGVRYTDEHIATKVGKAAGKK